MDALTRLVALKMSNFVLISVLLCAVYLVAKYGGLVLSAVLDALLRFRFPVTHLENASSLPTVPYVWPNGQGDTSKFLQGKENSERWGNKYGRLYRIWSGTTPEVVVTCAEHVQAIFRDSDKHSKAVSNNSGYLMSQILGQCVGLISGSAWRSVRSVTEKPFLRNVCKDYTYLVQRRTARHFSELAAAQRFAAGVVHPAEDLKMLPFWIVAEVIYGELSPEMEATLRDIAPKREALFKHVIAGGLARFSWSRYLPTAANTALVEYQTQWRAFNLEARRHALEAEPSAPIVAMFDAVDSNHLSEEQLLQTLDEMLYANLDVTLGGISWNLVFLAAHPEQQQRLRDEVAERRDMASNTSSDLSAYYQSSSTFLAACINESSRLRPLAAFSVPQSIPTDRVIDGYLFPAGTHFIVDSYALNIRNPFWGADREKYRPARFLDLKATDARYHFWRFGFGPRQCAGKYLADIMLRAMLVYLVEHYELHLLDDKGEWQRDPDMWINHPQLLLGCRPRKKG